MSRARTPLRGWLWGLAAFCLLALAASPGWCGERGVVLTSLEWPPYCSASLPGGGITTRVVRAAFQEAGYRVEVRFLPWQRAVEQARENPGVAAVFPEYGSGRPDIDFLTSDVIGLSTLGLVEVVDRPVDWRTLDDLSRYRLGTVKGYLNTDAFDRMAVRGAFEIDSSVSDLLNLRKVMVGRVDLAVADVNVFRYLGQADPALRRERHRLRVNARLLGINTMHVLFRRGPEGERLLRDFNRGLGRLDVEEMQQRYLDEVFAGGE